MQKEKTEIKHQLVLPVTFSWDELRSISGCNCECDSRAFFYFYSRGLEEIPVLSMKMLITFDCSVAL